MKTTVTIIGKDSQMRFACRINRRETGEWGYHEPSRSYYGCIYQTDDNGNMCIGTAFGSDVPTNWRWAGIDPDLLITSNRLLYTVEDLEEALNVQLPDCVRLALDAIR